MAEKSHPRTFHDRFQLNIQLLTAAFLALIGQILPLFRRHQFAEPGQWMEEAPLLLWNIYVASQDFRIRQGIS